MSEFDKWYTSHYDVETRMTDPGHRVDLLEAWMAGKRSVEAEIERLQAIVDRLEKDASGAPVVGAQEMYHPDETTVGVFDGWNQVVFDDLGGTAASYPVEDCWPSREAADAARAEVVE